MTKNGRLLTRGLAGLTGFFLIALPVAGRMKTQSPTAKKLSGTRQPYVDYAFNA